MNLFHYRLPAAAFAALSVVLLSGTALAQQGDGFLDNLFNRGGDQQQQSTPPVATQSEADGRLNARIDRIENALRQLTGTVEELQHQNQLLQTQVQQLSGGTARPQMQRGPAPGPVNAPMPGRRSEASPPSEPSNAPVALPSVAESGAATRGDAFNPALHPNAPGVPRALNREVPGSVGAPIGAPGGREAGAPLDLTSLSPNGQPLPGPGAAGGMGGALPPPPPRNPSATGAKLATLPPSASPKDEYELAYGYVLHKDYGLATQAFRDFLKKYPNERLVPDAQYWLGESLYQQQHYEDAARSFLTVSTKYSHFSKAPESLLRLGQSLAGMHQRDAACATLGAVKNKYPHASAGVKRAVAQEQKRVHC